MNDLSLILDLILGISLIGLSVLAVFGRDLYGSIIAFIAVGVFMSLVWVRLQAPDIALAEAILGGGVTGALLLAALSRLEKLDDNNNGASE